MEKSIFITGEDGQTESWYIMGSTTLGGVTYLLVSDSMDEEEATEAKILRERSADGGDVLYEDVTDEKERDAVADLFDALLEGSEE